jgi:hypothetical protein
MSPTETYLAKMREIRNSGIEVPETSYYSALDTLLNEIGATLRPKVCFITHTRNMGAGIPDGALFTNGKIRPDNVFDGPPPDRGVIEIKSPREQAATVAKSPQVARYLERYGQVLVTNYREFILIGKDTHGQPLQLESYQLAATEAEFWSQTARVQATAKKHARSFEEYLKRALMQTAALDTPADVAFFLASYAREAAYRIEAGSLPSAAGIRSAMEEGLGLKFEGERGEHFFRSSLVQTLFYGIFSAWVLWSKSNSPASNARFDWRTTVFHLQLPVLRKLFLEVADPAQLRALDLSEVLNWAGATLDRVDRRSFFEKFEEAHAVQYFYEPFLEAFDPELRKELGVWYTPEEIVRYSVERIDTVLREELNIEDGLADPRVYVLDPCCGTGAYLVGVLQRIAQTLREKGDDALTSHDLKRAAMERVFGFELLPAPFVVAHLQLGLLLQHMGAALSDERNERAAVYLTNALTGWEPPKHPKQHLLFRELEDEREAADRVKREEKILVILGNPPYNSFSGVAMGEERDLSTAYKTTKLAAAPQGQGLNDLYVRFFRMAERRIVEKTGQGVVCFISNYSWLDGLSFTGMRERYLEAFDKIWIDCLNGDKYKTGKLTPDGDSDPSVFSTEMNREGIQVGTAISLLVRAQGDGAAEVRFRHLWGKTKRQDLLQLPAVYETVQPSLKLGLPFAPMQVTSQYLSWPRLPELFPLSYPGVKTSRDDVVVDIDRDRLVERIEQYFDSEIDHAEMARIAPGAMDTAGQFRAEKTRDYLRKRGLIRENFVRFCYRPFDLRWLYWEPETKLLDRNRSEYFAQVFDDNLWLSAVQQNRKAFDPPLFAPKLCSLHVIERGANLFPLLLRSPASLLNTEERAHNLSEAARNYLAKLGAVPEQLFHHVLAATHAPAYATENDGALRQDWPRIPLPDSLEALQASAALGRRIAELLDPESKVRLDCKDIAVVSCDEGQIDTHAGDLDVTAGWGHSGKGGAVMPAKGKLVRHADALDVYLNDRVYWKNVPIEVWEYTLGGYQVIKKWLSYRERPLLGRGLTVEEVRYVSDVARRIASILHMSTDLNSNYARVKS